MSDFFTFTDYLDKFTGEGHRIYKYKGKPCKRILLESKLTAQLAGYALIEKDLRSVVVWAKLLDDMQQSSNDDGQFIRPTDREKFNVVKGLFVATLTFYGKCFSKCDARPVKLERRCVPESFQWVHDLCIKYRHNFAAHSGLEKVEYAKIVLVIPKHNKKGRVLPKNIFSELFQPDLTWHSDESGSDFIKLFEAVLEFVRGKIFQLSQKIYSEDVFTKDDEYWRSQ